MFTSGVLVPQRTWFIAGLNSAAGRALAIELMARGCVVTSSVEEVAEFTKWLLRVGCELFVGRHHGKSNGAKAENRAAGACPGPKVDCKDGWSMGEKLGST